MPKKTRRRKADKKVNKATQKNIARAIEQIPGMIMREVRMEDLRPRDPHVIERPEPGAKSGRPGWQPLNRHMLMWAGVTALSGIIFVMWFLNAKNTINAIRQAAPSQERELLATAREDLRAIMKSLVQAERDELGAAVNQATPEEVKTTVTNALRGLFLSAAAANDATATSTPSPPYAQ